MFDCCRDSVEAIQHSLSSEPVKVLGHSQVRVAFLCYHEILTSSSFTDHLVVVVS